ncbi:MAG: NAD(P)/FAD-dependent oxidoreductase [Candidatus Methanofastidiosa archaeon]|nr:NAD(P)/FAD-dependent oxidoreductase [Candidatus Methanofastidiosa archaeon]
MRKKVVIIGAGPAGLFSAYKLSNNNRFDIVLLDKGRDVDSRKCQLEYTGVCENCDPCNVLYGTGGSGCLSDGILNLRPDIGGDLEELTNDAKKAQNLVDEVDSIFLKHGAPENLFIGETENIENLQRKSEAVGIKFIQIPQRHIGSDYTPVVINSIKKYLEKKGVKFVSLADVIRIKKEKNIYKTTYSQNKQTHEINSEYIIAAPGRAGSGFLMSLIKDLGIKIEHQPIDIGVRVEVSKVVMQPVIDVNRDPKFHIYSKTYDDFVRTFCTNHEGYVMKEQYDGYVGVNGHSMRDIKSPNSNFAFLSKVTLTSPVEDTTSYGVSIAKIATVLGGGNPLVQRFGDLRRGRRSTPERIKRSKITPTLLSATPGDIAMALPYRIVTNLIESLEMLDNVIPGVGSDSTLLYAPEIKFYGIRVKVNNSMETNIPNLFVAGDGVGLSRDIVNSASTGILAAEGILKKESSS